MGIIKILVDGCECQYITSIDNDYIEENDDINCRLNDISEDTIKIKNIFNDDNKLNGSSEING